MQSKQQRSSSLWSEICGHGEAFPPQASLIQQCTINFSAFLYFNTKHTFIPYEAWVIIISCQFDTWGDFKTFYLLRFVHNLTHLVFGKQNFDDYLFAGKKVLILESLLCSMNVYISFKIIWLFHIATLESVQAREIDKLNISVMSLVLHSFHCQWSKCFFQLWKVDKIEMGFTWSTRYQAVVVIVFIALLCAQWVFFHLFLCVPREGVFVASSFSAGKWYPQKLYFKDASYLPL